jgi:hypothetical protein
MVMSVDLGPRADCRRFFGRSHAHIACPHAGLEGIMMRDGLAAGG